jgi:hypothetical protein
MHGQKNAPLKPLALSPRRRLERFPMPAEPYLDNAVAAHPRVDAAGNGLHLRQLWHRSIVQFAKKLDSEGGGGFNPRIRPTESTWAIQITENSFGTARSVRA